MAATYKINDDFYDESFSLIALHTTLEDFALAYGLNQSLKAKFVRAKKNFNLAENKSFPIFEWEDEFNDMYWVLVANHSSEKELVTHDDLFKNETTYKTPRLIPEYKDVDYLLKIETEKDFDTNSLIKNILMLPRVMAAYEISTEKLKSKNNLIF
ncbi:IPExxxVDY family protein [Maribacter stanieri]|uniref:IPExxxVDY family protein n=1 Tax=Maribacter stanieri TaxID=440514 RepID=UPI00249599EE|nr:IPExxxVDY family protein [Maribacter stanieri]|tara:strand:- start:967 stop:1431 length:465 start_codon:yes stop_codon:yes gene_type:complete